MTPLRRIRFGLAVLGAVLIMGTVGYMLIAGVTVFDALYMVVITITTVGFGEIFEMSETARAWTLGILVVGFGVALYTAAASIEYLVDLGESRRKKRMENEVARLTDHIIVCGFGRVGHGTWRALKGRDADVVIVETDVARADAAEADDAYVIRGDATHNDVLELAGIHSAQALVACVADDSDNLVIALSVKALCPDLRVICRATELESERKLRLAGADAVVAPQAVGAERLALMAMQPELAQIFDVVINGSPLEFHVEELDIDAASAVAGKTLRDSQIRQDSGALVLVVEAGKESLTVNPGPDVTLNIGDRLVVVGTREQVDRAAVMLKPAG